jgi:pimeloyl-ACP methyl ester carboxylesterase
MVPDYQADATNAGKPGRPSEQASERARTPHEHARRRRLTLALAVAGLLILFAAPAGAADPVRAAGGEAAGAQRGNFAGRVEIRGGRKIYLECRGSGGPTVILVSGHGNAADIWGEKARVEYQKGLMPELFPGLDLPVRGPAVLRGVARLTRVCAYDRPNNRLLDDRPSRSDPVPQPATAGSSVADLHALLRAARVPGPYLLVGHSFGGLIVRLYATTYPRQVAGIVSVDATTEFQRDQLTPQQNALVEQFTFEADSAPGIDPPLEIADFNTSFDQMIRAKAARPLRPTLPMVVLTRGLPQLFPPPEALPPGFPDQDTNERTWRTAQGWLAALVPYARHVIARKSEHYIQTEQPRLVIDAVRRELRMVRPTTVRCRGGGDSCRARVSLAGGASNKRVTIELSDSDLRLVSVRPNRRSLRGAYGLFGQRLRSGGSQYLVRLNAVQSIPPGSDLIFTFRASGGR